MADRTFNVVLATPERTVYNGTATSLVVKAWDGYLGVLAGHAPLMTLLGIGEIRIKEPNLGETWLVTSGGFMEVKDDRASILADAVERPELIDVERARAAAERARFWLQGAPDESVDITRARAALERAENRLRIAQGAR